MAGGFFVALEGTDGAGKSTQVNRLVRALIDAGEEVIATREPGGTELGERIRELLLGENGYAILAPAEALLFAAARAQHVAEVINPALQDGKIVVCDRFVDSSLAYQGGGRGLNMPGLRAVQVFATGGLKPDLRVLLQIPVEIGLSRRSAAAGVVNHLDRAGVDFYERVQAVYAALVSEEPESWLVVDASGDSETVGYEIALAVVDRIHSTRSMNS